MTDDAKGAETIGIIRRLRDRRFSDDELDAMLNRLNELLGDHDINALHVAMADEAVLVVRGAKRGSAVPRVAGGEAHRLPTFSPA